jgi:hypothetical protein
MARKIVPALSSNAITWPSNANESAQNARHFFENYGFPGTVGAIDGSHISIANPSPDYTTRKYSQAITLQAIVNQNLKFIDTFVGCSGHMHDARLYQYSPISEHLADPTFLQGLHVIGDGANPISHSIRTPFADNGHLNDQKISYNYKLSAG